MYLINGSITPLPFRLHLPNGSSRTSLNELTDTQLAELNIYPADEVRPELLSTQYYGEPEISISDGRATAVYPVIDYSEAELITMFAEVKEAKKAEITQSRFEAETAGIYGIKTDRESQALLTGAVLQAVIDPTYSLSWKTIDGTFVSLSAEEIMTVGRTVREYVQSQFNKEEALCGMIDSAATIEEVKKITWSVY
jgi:hypothetical protein